MIVTALTRAARLYQILSGTKAPDVRGILALSRHFSVGEFCTTFSTSVIMKSSLGLKFWGTIFAINVESIFLN